MPAAVFRLAAYFAAYIGLVAPLQFHIDLFFNWRLGSADPIGAALATGTLYFAGAVIAGEAWLRCEQHPDLYKGNKSYTALKLSSLVILGIAVVTYLIDTFKISEKHTDHYPADLQVIVCATAMITAGAAFFIMISADQKRRSKNRSARRSAA